MADLQQALRKETVEHIFGIIKQNHGFRRFTAWGLEGASAQWSLVCIATNLRKLVPMLISRRLRGSALATA